MNKLSLSHVMVDFLPPNRLHISWHIRRVIMIIFLKYPFGHRTMAGHVASFSLTAFKKLVSLSRSLRSECLV